MCVGSLTLVYAGFLHYIIKFGHFSLANQSQVYLLSPERILGVKESLFLPVNEKRGYAVKSDKLRGPHVRSDMLSDLK